MKAGGFLVGTLLLGNLTLMSALSVHVVRSPEQAITLVPKSQLTLVDTYVDTREWTPQDVTRHPALVARLTDAGKAELISHVTDAACCPAPTTSLKHVSAPATQPAHAEVNAPTSVFDFGRDK